jgi:uncharacterized protein YyaL (SSP411 family)
LFEDKELKLSISFFKCVVSSLKMRNFLSQETSPYLLQHQDNPVHWYPWNKAAFNTARKLDKPLLLSVGYSACHWCHVMAHESFEHPETAALMNEKFINIKVDREERPDLDKIYQEALRHLGGQGGWPLTIFLTPEGQPFAGGTYFPLEPRHGLPGFRQVLEAVSHAYRADKQKILKFATALTQHLAKGEPDHSSKDLSIDLVDQTASRLLLILDPVSGGMKGAPKFPQAPFFQLLWKAFKRTQQPELRDAVVLMLNTISRGGIYDHLGGGYCRYSTDEDWLVPHFEKMLYDNAQLIDLLTSVWQETKSPLMKNRICDTIGWLLREMTVEEAFASALDADSEGEEGKFYVWDEAQLDALPLKNTEAFKQAYDITPSGNWEGKVILNQLNVPWIEDEEASHLKNRHILFVAREQRPRPGRDDKVLADWNGLMIAALAYASATLEQPEWLTMAQKSFDFIVSKMEQNGKLCHSWCKGKLQPIGFLNDYAAMVKAALALFQVTGQMVYLAHVERWMVLTREDFWDQEKGGYFQTTTQDQPLVRLKDAEDGALPSGNGLMAENLVYLYYLTGKSNYRDLAEAIFKAFSIPMVKHPLSYTTLLGAYDIFNHPLQITVVGDCKDPEAQAFLKAIYAYAHPHRIVYPFADPGSLAPSHPAYKPLVQGKPTAYICKNMTCLEPFTNLESFKATLLSI